MPKRKADGESDKKKTKQKTKKDVSEDKKLDAAIILNHFINLCDYAYSQQGSDYQQVFYDATCKNGLLATTWGIFEAYPDKMDTPKLSIDNFLIDVCENNNVLVENYQNMAKTLIPSVASLLKKVENTNKCKDMFLAHYGSLSSAIKFLPDVIDVFTGLYCRGWNKNLEVDENSVVKLDILFNHLK